MPTKHRQSELANVLFEVLPVGPPGLPLAEVRRLILDRFTLTAEEQRINNYVGGWTDGLVKRGWLVKENGHWWATASGVAAAAEYRDDPEGFYRAWVDPYPAGVARTGRTRRAAGTTYSPGANREQQFASAVTLARVVLATRNVLEPQRRKLLTEILWFATQVDGKYTCRYRSAGARALIAGGTPTNLLRHDHVLTRKELTETLLADPERVDEIIRSAIGCVVTKDEHDRLSSLSGSASGWERYLAARIDVFDELTGAAFIRDGRFA
jgi:hypothetical protein